jgi:hypothetical protein
MRGVQISVEVTNRGKKNEVKAVVGSGKVSLSSAIPALRQQPPSMPVGAVSVEIPLFAPSAKKDQGKVLLRCELVAMPAAAAASTSPPAAAPGSKTGAAASSSAPAGDSKHVRASSSAPAAGEAPLAGKKEGAPTPAASAPAASAPTGAAAGAAPSAYRLRISGLQAKELANTGGFMDKQDPALKVTVGSESKETER